MRLLLDTHLLLWAVGRSAGLSETARELIDAPENSVSFSAASVWEVAIKYGLGRHDFRIDPRMLRPSLLAHRYTELPVTGEHAVAVRDLPPLHKDPFDRLLVAQSLVEGITLLTADRQLAGYSEAIRLV